jgi:hypothetical protein
MRMYSTAEADEDVRRILVQHPFKRSERANGMVSSHLIRTYSVLFGAEILRLQEIQTTDSSNWYAKFYNLSRMGNE